MDEKRMNPKENPNRTRVGMLLTFIGCVSNAFASTLLNQNSASFSPLTLAFYASLLTALFFLGTTMRHVSFWLCLSQHKRPLCWLNLSTLFSWLMGFYSLLFISPVLSIAILCGLQPLCILVLSRFIRAPKFAGFSSLDVFFSLCITVLLGVLIVYYLVIETHHTIFAECLCLVGVILSICAGFMAACNTIFVKILSQQGLSSGTIMALRFWLLVVFAMMALAYTRGSLALSLSQLPALGFLVLMYNIIPLFLFQRAIVLTDPITVSLIVPLQPLLTYIFESHMANIKHALPSSLLFFIILISTLIMIAALLKERQQLFIFFITNHRLRIKIANLIWKRRYRT